MFYKDSPDILPLMTLIVCLKNKNGVVMAGDRRAIYPDTLSYTDITTKVTRINKSVILGAAGNSFDCEPLIESVKKQSQKLSVEEVVNLIKKLADEKHKEWYTDVNLLLIYQVFSITHDKLIPDKVIANHCEMGITTIANYLCSIEDIDKMNLKEMRALAKKTIVETSRVIAAVSKKVDVLSV
jgi:ATP-dependent protease HslVU (ClpYQ) peptidase subunit